MSEVTLPWTPPDLRDLAGRMEKILEVVGEDIPDEDNDWRWGLEVVLRDSAGFLQGRIKPHGDGWMGFYPAEVNS